MTTPVTMKSTKEKIYEAWRAAEAKLQAQKEMNFQPPSQTSEQPSLDIQGIETYFQSTVASLRKNYLSASAKLGELHELITKKDDELREVYGIEREVGMLANFIDTKRDETEKLIRDHNAMKFALSNELSFHKEELAQERRNLDRSHAEKVEEAKKANERAVAEFTYDFERQKKMARDNLDDELTANRRLFDEDCAKERQRLADLEDDLVKREDACSEIESEMGELRTELEELKAAKDVAVAEAVARAKEAARGQMEAALRSQKVELEAKLTVSEERLNSRNAQVAELQETAKNLTTKLEAAYDRINALALQSMDSTKATETAARFEKLAADAAANAKRPGN
jgi:chromosome segregation ATPase